MSEQSILDHGLQPHRRIFFEKTLGEFGTFSYLLGNTKPMYIDMSSCTLSPVRCLFLGCGDLRHMLHIIETSAKISDWEFHLVDISPAIIARNLLFLHLIADKQISISVLWSIWYDFLLDTNTFTQLKRAIYKSLASSLDFVRDIDRPIIVETLLSWLRLSMTSDRRKSQQQREKLIQSFLATNRHSSWNSFIDELRGSIRELLDGQAESKIVQAENEIECYIRHGFTGRSRDDFHINPTMLQPSSGLYTGHYEMHPFLSYFPFENINEIDRFQEITEGKSYPLFEYCYSQFDRWIRTCRTRERDIFWHLWCGDALHLALFHMPLLEFDLIHTSNLGDHIGVLNILVTCMPLLRHRSSSRILTQSLMWWNMYGQYFDYFLQLFNKVESYWLPSLLGLKAECARDSKPNMSQKQNNPLNKLTRHCEYQTWRLAVGVQVRFDKIHKDVLNAFDKIAEHCFYPRDTYISAYDGKAICTTLTYYLFLRQYAKRCCIPADETFNFLLNRTCDKYRAYATAIRTLHDMFTEGTYVDTYKQMLTPYPAHCKFQNHLPMLQLLIIDHIDRNSIDEILREINADTQCNLETGILRLSRTRRTFQSHLIDNFAFRKAISATNEGFIDDTYAHTMLAQNASIHFVLPSSFASSRSTLGLLIDTHSWYLFSIIDLSSPNSIVHSNASFAIGVRDAVCSCLANITDRISIHAHNGSKNRILLTHAYETKSNYHLSFQVNTSLTLSEITSTRLKTKTQTMTINFSDKTRCAVSFAFPCPLQPFKTVPQVENSVLSVTIPKDTAELLSLVIFNRNTPTFDRNNCERWPPARLSNGQLIPPPLDIRSLQSSEFEFNTKVLHQNLDSMFAAMEVFKANTTHLSSDVDYNLRRSIFELFLIAFISRRRVLWYKIEHNGPELSNDIRMYGDILFILDGIYRHQTHDKEPFLSLFYLDTSLIPENSVHSITNETRTIIRSELGIQVKQIAGTRGSNCDTDSCIINVWGNIETLSLMRKLLEYNSKNMTDESKRHSFPSPWKASYLELLRSDSRGLVRQSPQVSSKSPTVSDGNGDCKIS